MAKLEQENILLKQALNSLLATKEYKDIHGEDETYKMFRRMAWRRVEDVLNLCTVEDVNVPFCPKCNSKNIELYNTPSCECKDCKAYWAI